VERIDSLLNAISRGDASAVSRLLAAAPELARARDATTLPVLQFARYADQPAILQALIDAGPPLTIFEAATIDRVDRVREILAADPSQATAFSDDGFTALHFAAYFGATAAISALLDAGAGIEAVTGNFLTNMPLHAAAAGGRVASCELLLSRGANVNAKQHGGFTPLMTPCFSNNREMAELFLAHGADPNVTNDEGKTAADVAAGMGNMEIAAFLRAMALTTT
jgi:ankyrin repeat protein